MAQTEIVKKTKRLYPAAGRKPRHPQTTRRVSTSGEVLEITPEVARMIRDGDLVEKKPNKSAAVK